MTAVGGQQFSDLQSFSDRHDGRIDKAERGIRIFGHHIGSPNEIISLQEFNFHLSPYDRLHEFDFNMLAQMGRNQITHLGEDGKRDDQLPVGHIQERNGPIMPAIIAVDHGIQGPCIHQNRFHDLRFACGEVQSSSSARSAMSFLPLRPIPAQEGKVPVP